MISRVAILLLITLLIVYMVVDYDNIKDDY